MYLTIEELEIEKTKDEDVIVFEERQYLIKSKSKNSAFKTGEEFGYKKEYTYTNVYKQQVFQK